MKATTGGAMLACFVLWGAPAAAQLVEERPGPARIAAGTPAPVPDGTRFEPDVVIDGPRLR